MKEQELNTQNLAGTWKFESWKTLYANFHPDMEPKEGSNSWEEIEIGKENPTSEIMEVVFKSRENFSRSKMTLNNTVKSGPWLEAQFIIGSESKEGYWEYDKDENTIAFLVDGYDYNLYFHVKQLSENEMIVIEKVYKSESDAYFNYISLKREK